MTSDHKPLTKDSYGSRSFNPVTNEMRSQIYEDRVRSAVEGLRFQYAALSGFEALQSNTQSERAYDNALKLLDNWFPVFKDEEEVQK